MKKLVLTAGLVGSLFAGNMNSIEIKNVLSHNKILAPLAKYITKGYDNGKYYIFKLPVRGNPTAYITKSGETFIGIGFDKQGKVIKQPINANIVKKGIAFSFGKKGGEELYIVTDPECPFCRRFAKMSEGKLKNYRIHIILMPLSFHHDSKAMCYYILAGKTDKEKEERFKNTITQKNTNYKNFTPTKSQLAADSNYLLDGKKAADELGATGTPSVYDKNFKPISWPKLVR